MKKYKKLLSQLSGKVLTHHIFAINVGRYTKTAEEQRSAFTEAKSIWDEAALGLLAA